MEIQREDWLNGKNLKESRLRSEGINVLGIKKPDGRYQGNPSGETRIAEKDSLILYGRINAIAELDSRRKEYLGDREHREAMKEQKQVVLEEQEKTDERKLKED